MARYSDARGRFVRGEELTLHASGAETETVSGDWFNTEEVNTLDLFLDVDLDRGRDRALDLGAGGTWRVGWLGS